MNRQEALIELMKGKKINANNAGYIYVKNLDSGCPKFIYVSNVSKTENPLYSALDCINILTLHKEYIIKIDNKEIKLSEESFNELKKQLLD